MRFTWLFIWCIIFGVVINFHYPNMEPFSKDFYMALMALVCFQMVHIWLLDRFFPKNKIEKIRVKQLIIDHAKGTIAFTMLISDIQKKYSDKTVYEILKAEGVRLEKELERYGSLKSQNDFSLYIIDNKTEFLYTIEARTDRAKKILCDISKSFDLMGLM